MRSPLRLEGGDRTSYTLIPKLSRFSVLLQGLVPADLAAVLGSEMVVTETLTGDRELSIAQVETLSNPFRIDPNVFI